MGGSGRGGRGQLNSISHKEPRRSYRVLILCY